MSKRPNKSNAPASEDVFGGRFKAADNNVVLLREIVESSDIASIAAAIGALLTGGSSSAPIGSELRRRVRPLTVDILLDALKFLGRFHLDALLFTCKLTRNLVIHQMRDDCLRFLSYATLRRHPRRPDECLWLRAEAERRDHFNRSVELTVSKEEANEVFCNVIRCAYVNRFHLCEPALKMVVDRRHYLSFDDVDFKAVSPRTFLGALLSLDALHYLGFYSVRNQTSAHLNDRLLLALAKNGLRRFSHGGNVDHVTGDMSGHGIIKFLTFDDAQRSLTVNHPRLSSSFISELIGAAKFGLIARSDPPREVLKLYIASEALDISSLSQYNTEIDPHQFPIWTKYFVGDKITIEHSYCGLPYFQLWS